MDRPKFGAKFALIVVGLRNKPFEKERPPKDGEESPPLRMSVHAVAPPIAPSSEKYVDPPGAIGVTKLTVPLVWLLFILAGGKYEFGPPYPVLSRGLRGAPNVVMPSPSNPKILVAPNVNPNRLKPEVRFIEEIGI